MKTDYQDKSMLDMVFENRNKEYGAYVLRRDYDKQMKRAIGITVSSICLFIGASFIATKLQAEEPNKKYTDGIHNMPEIELPQEKIEIIEEKIVEPQTAQAKATIANTTMQVVNEDMVQADSVPTVEDLRFAESGLTTNLNGSQTMGVDGGAGTADLLEATFTVAKAVQPAILDFAEVMPQFPGGEEALMRFLVINTEYPDRERGLEMEGKVLIKFVVNEDGTVSAPNILRSSGPGFTKEAMRVIGKLPKFKPGMQQGKPVKVNFALPFVWRLN